MGTIFSICLIVAAVFCIFAICGALEDGFESILARFIVMRTGILWGLIGGAVVAWLLCDYFGILPGSWQYSIWGVCIAAGFGWGLWEVFHTEFN